MPSNFPQIWEIHLLWMFEVRFNDKHLFLLYQSCSVELCVESMWSPVAECGDRTQAVSQRVREGQSCLR